MNNDLTRLRELLNEHRDKAFITCEETCWCWDVEQAIYYQENELKILPISEKIRKLLADCLWLLDILGGFENEIDNKLSDEMKKIYWDARNYLNSQADMNRKLKE